MLYVVLFEALSPPATNLWTLLLCVCVVAVSHARGYWMTLMFLCVFWLKQNSDQSHKHCRVEATKRACKLINEGMLMRFMSLSLSLSLAHIHKTSSKLSEQWQGRFSFAKQIAKGLSCYQEAR